MRKIDDIVLAKPVYIPCLYLPRTRLQLGQEWVTSCQLFMQKGIRQHGQHPTKHSTPATTYWKVPVFSWTIVVMLALQLVHVMVTGCLPKLMWWPVIVMSFIVNSIGFLKEDSEDELSDRLIRVKGDFLEVWPIKSKWIYTVLLRYFSACLPGIGYTIYFSITNQSRLCTE